MFVLKRPNIASRQQITTISLLQKQFKHVLCYTASNWYLYFDTTANSNQIKCYLTTNTGSFLDMQFGFYRYALLADLLWLVVEKVFTKNSRKVGTRLFGASL